MSTVSGVVLDAGGNPAERTVRAHSRATGTLLGSTVSNPTTGAYSMSASEECYIVCLDSGAVLNALIQDRVIPV